MSMFFSFVLALVRRFAGRIESERGQTMAEYGILIAVIAVIVVLAATLLGSNTSKLFSSTGGHL
jgi:pilus assembly protein Flp/PilA